MIKFKNIKFKYNKEYILKGVSFSTIDKGIVSLIGENGSGKSTLINQISNMGKYQGEIFINKTNIKEIGGKSLSKIFSFLPQKIHFPEEIMVFDVIKIGRDPHTNIWGFLGKKDKMIIKKYAKKVGVSELMEKSFTSLSGGQQQRVLLAMTLCQETSIIILDEPTNHLDIKYQIEFFETVKKLKKDKLILITTHNINLAAKYSDQVVLLDQGQILAEGNASVISKNNLKTVFGINAEIKKINGKPIIVDMEL